MGIAPLDRLLAQEDLTVGSLCRVLPLWHFNPVPVFALTPTKFLPEKTRAFLKFLNSRMKAGMNTVEDFKRREEVKSQELIVGLRVRNAKNRIVNSVSLSLSPTEVRS